MMIALVVCGAWAIPWTEVPNPRLGGAWVSDVAGVIDGETEARLNERIAALERATRVEIAVVTVPDTGELEPKEYATELLNGWGVGKRDANNGLVVLLATGRRRLEMETGYGLEGALTDGWLGAMQARVMVPRLRDGDFAGGLEAGIAAVDAELRGAPATPSTATPSTATPSTAAPSLAAPSLAAPSLAAPPAFAPPVARASITTLVLGALAALGTIGVFLLAWLRLAKRARTCAKCSVEMPLLDELADDEHLTEGQRAEENVGSVDHQVRVCPQCGEVRIRSASRWFSGFGRCTACGHRTLKSRSTTLRPASYVQGGEVEVSEACEHCSFRNTYRRLTPRLQRAASHGSFRGGGFSGRSGGGGGRSGGGGSFGGGRSGGGGAGSSF